MKSHDFGFNYLMLARSPLYLFLLVNSRPWASSDVNCLADIFSLFVKYWLERDIEKGRSRWGLTTDDRLDFMTAVAWKMFQERRHALTFNEFDACVRKFIGPGPKDEDYVSLGLDLQTTGIFNCVGNVLQFFAPGFLDYFVVEMFSDAAFPTDDLPKRLPTADQVSMWAGLAETHKNVFEYKYQPGKVLREPYNAGAYLQRLGMENIPELYGKIHLDPGRIIYHLPPGDWNWPYLNAEHYPASIDALCRGNLRIVINAVLQRVEADKWTEIRIRIMTRKGLHARVAAKVCAAYETWRRDFIGREAPEITARREGDTDTVVGLDSIMGMLTLGAGPGMTVIIEYSKCTRGEAEALLELMKCEKGDEPGLWFFCLLEIDSPPPTEVSEMMVGRFKPQ